MYKNHVIPFFSTFPATYLVVVLLICNHAVAQNKNVKFNFFGVIYNESTSKPLEGVNINLVKNKQVVQSMITPANGKY